MFECSFEGCKKTFSRQKKLDDHMNKHVGDRPYSCDMCEKSYHRNSHLTVHKKKHFPPGFRCSCGYSCHTKDRLDRHTKTCVEYQCTVCRKKYKKKAWFDAHVDSHHRKTTKSKGEHRCEYCKFTFSKQYNLGVHILSVHLKAKPFRCSCGKMYAHALSLDRHRARCAKDRDNSS